MKVEGGGVMAVNPNVAISVNVQDSRAQIKDLSGQIKELDKGFAAASETMKQTGTAADFLTAKQKTLEAQFSKQREITDKNREVMKHYAEQVAKLSDELIAFKMSGVDEKDINKKAYALEQSEKTLADWQKRVEASEMAERKFTAQIVNTNAELKIHSGALAEASGKMQVFSDNYARGAESVRNVRLDFTLRSASTGCCLNPKRCRF
jgi:chromosome segregation ATPase